MVLQGVLILYFLSNIREQFDRNVQCLPIIIKFDCIFFFNCDVHSSGVDVWFYRGF